MNRKIYSQNMVRISTFLAGLLAGAYLMARNYKTFGEEKKAKKAILAGLTASAVIFGTLFSLPEPLIDKIPNFLLPVIFVLLIHLAVEKFQGPAITQFLAEGGEQYSGWKVAGVSLMVLLLEIAAAALLIFGAILLFE